LSIGIVGYGSYVPPFRIRASQIASQWGCESGDSSPVGGALEKSVPGLDEDTATIAVEASERAIASAGIDPRRIGAVYVGSESHPYAVKPTGALVVDALGIGPDVHVADFEFACKAGTEAMYCAFSQVKAGEMDYALGVGADTAQGAPGDALEYTAAAGGAAFVFGRGENVAAEVIHTHSFTSDTPDFWRRDGRKYPNHAGRYTGEPAYFRHVLGCAGALLEKSKLAPSDFAACVFHMPNQKFPQSVAKTLGFTKDQLRAGLVFPRIGNTYAGSAPLGLTAVLDELAPGDLAFVVSYGSGAGSDGFVFRATSALPSVRRRKRSLLADLDGRRVYLDYAKYARYRGKILMND
jgi:hydroxymethylglutaryl-CoA synthase